MPSPRVAHLSRPTGHRRRWSSVVRRCVALVAIVFIGSLVDRRVADADSGASTVGGSGIEAAVPGRHLHSGGHHGVAACDWIDVIGPDNLINDEMMAKIDADHLNYLGAFEGFGGSGDSFAQAAWIKSHPLVENLKIYQRICGGATTWIVVPVVFFMLWPVKGYQYLLPIAPPVAILAGRALALLPTKGRFDVGGWRVPKVVASGAVAADLQSKLHALQEEYTGLHRSMELAMKDRDRLSLEVSFLEEDKGSRYYHWLIMVNNGIG